MSKRHEQPKADDRSSLVNGDPAHAPGKQHIDRGQIGKSRHTTEQLQQFERNIPMNDRVVRRSRTLRGR